MVNFSLYKLPETFMLLYLKPFLCVFEFYSFYQNLFTYALISIKVFFCLLFVCFLTSWGGGGAVLLVGTGQPELTVSQDGFCIIILLFLPPKASLVHKIFSCLINTFCESLKVYLRYIYQKVQFIYLFTSFQFCIVSNCIFHYIRFVYVYVCMSVSLYVYMFT